MTSEQVAISRSSLSLADLVITGDGSGPYSLTDTGLARPGRTVRATFADVSPHVEGQLMTQAVRDITSLPLEVIVSGSSSADLVGLLDALDAALFQFRYTTTVTSDGTDVTWPSLPTSFDIVGGSVLYSRRSQFFEVVSFTIPVQPTPVSL